MRKITTVYIDWEDLEELKKIAQREDSSICKIIRGLIKDFLEKTFDKS